MQMILNELSAKFPTETIEDGKVIMQSFLDTCFKVKRIIQNDSVLLDKDYKSFELAKGYRIEKWRNDPTVDKEEKRRFGALLNKSVVYNSSDFELETDGEFKAEFGQKEYTSKGCLIAYETQGVMVSFLSDEYWEKPEIQGLYLELSLDGEIEENKVSIPNVSFDPNISNFEKYYEQVKDEWRYTDIISGQDILECAEYAFPNLEFCENAIEGCKKYVGVSEAGQVYKRLLELQRAAEGMGDKFDKNVLTKATPESGVTLKQFEVEHTFQMPDGKIELFSWHVRYTGSYAGRIFFYPIPAERKIYIGHIGHKLPTVKYH